MLWNWGTLPSGQFYMSSERLETLSCATVVLITIVHSVGSWTMYPRDTISDPNKRSLLHLRPCEKKKKKNTSATNWCSQSDMLEHVSFHSVTPATQTAPDAEHGLCLETCVWSPGRASSRQDVHINKRPASSLHALPCRPAWCSHPQGVGSMCGTPESAGMWHESVRVCRSPCLTGMKVWWLAWLSSCHTVWKKHLSN